jgi:hypothetical protein
MRLLSDATPEQIGAAVVFLCSEAAAQIRGVALSGGRPLDRAIRVPV